MANIKKITKPIKIKKPAPQGNHQEEPEEPVVVAPAPAEPVAVVNSSDLASLPITLDTPYLDIGDYPREAWVQTLLQGSPLRAEIDAIINATSGVGALAREQTLKETSDGTDQTARQARNPLGLMARSANEPHIITSSGRMLRTFNSFAEAFAEYKRRITDPNGAYLGVGVETLGEYIDRYLLGWVPGNPNRPYPPGESAANAALYRQQMVDRLNQRSEEYGRIGDDTPAPAPTPGGPPADFKEWGIPGLGTFYLPKDRTVQIILTPKGVHRPGGRLVNPDGSTVHETGNRGNGANATMHSNWQDGCTQGHPDGYVGVSAYVSNLLIIVKIPLDEESIHSGDWRNKSQPSMEICVNADRNAAQTEETAQWWQANILRNKKMTARQSMYPHHSSGCPAIINGEGRWGQWEMAVDRKISLLGGVGTLPPSTTYAESFPVPKEWDGLDYKRADGQVFFAMQRVMVANKVTGAYQSTSKTSPKVRADLPKGEPFLCYYVTVTEGKLWCISQFGSRILAEDCDPRLSILVSGSWVSDAGPHTQPVLADPMAGLSAKDVPDDAPRMSKKEFMDD